MTPSSPSRKVSSDFDGEEPLAEVPAGNWADHMEYVEGFVEFAGALQEH